MNLDQIVDSGLCEQMTGCEGASGFRAYARSQGYGFVEVVNWTSSAGDWEFIVSKDGENWAVMTQTNNWPRPGFTRDIDHSWSFVGTAAEVLETIAEMYC